MSCLSTTSDPCEVIQHVFCNKNLYVNVVKSIGKSRAARNKGGMYCLYFYSPSNGSNITIRGERILEIFENPCKICWCSSIERCAGLAIINSVFFANVLLSFNEALKAKSESKLYCKSFKIPHCLFPNVATKDLCITLNGTQIIEMAYRAMSSGCCSMNK